MESLGTSFFLVILLIGIILVVRKRKSGLLLILISMIFIYLLSNQWFRKFKNEVCGRYESNLGRELIISSDNTYKVVENEVIVDSADLEFSNIDDGAVFFHGITGFERDDNGNFINESNRKEIFMKISAK